VYDDIGRGYTTTRQADPRIADAIRAALGGARSVLNVGAGAGSVIVTWDPAARDTFWLTAHYLPEIVHFDVARFPALDVFGRHFGDVRVEPLLIPHDCSDGFLGAFWRRPEAYLIPAVRHAMSGFAQLPAGTVDAGLACLATDLRSGLWSARFGALQATENADLGYRLVVARKGAA
jgi:hypothetical protein